MLRLVSKCRHAAPRVPSPALFPVRTLRALIVPALLAWVPPGSAQDTSAGEAAQETTTTVRDEIVVSASHLPVDGGTVGSSVTVIGREEIEASHATTVQELLRTVPGVAVAQLGGPGKASSVFVRGGNSGHTLVLIDGVRVNSNTAGLYDFADLTTDHIERIEVLRGPQSTLYGSEAVAGVISIISRRGEGAPSVTGGAE
ncbi:MAG: TonB-dependent receptor plug domain-containing protein, partial [Holophagales bacterium]|nr:TonB-dependent receptor plug domain-containing protein [Holophagales bacterium]